MAITAANDYSLSWYRLLLGERPPIYLFEIALRVVLIYGFTLLLLRWAGKRTMGELTFFDFAIIIALGSAVGDGMIYDNVPLIHSFLVVAGVIALERLMARLTEKNKQLERLVESESTLIIENGVIKLDKLHEESVSHEELFESLRDRGIHQLGQVALAYLEPTGKVSVIKNSVDRPGLSILPEGRRLFIDFTSQKTLCCKNCGTLAESSASDFNCSNCGKREGVEVTSSDCESTQQ